MFYGDWEDICLAVSWDGRHFERVLHRGLVGLFGEGARGRARDPMLTRHDGRWYCYYIVFAGQVRIGLQNVGVAIRQSERWREIMSSSIERPGRLIPVAVGPRRWLYGTLAGFFFSLGMVGVVLPGIPTTPFLLLMGYFLVRVSPDMHAKAMCWPVVGEPLRVWDQEGGVRPGVKAVAISMVVVLVGGTILISQLGWQLKLLIVCVALCGIRVVLRLPSARSG